jgi:hypothetical protein
LIGQNMPSPPEVPVDYDLTCWYLNQRRVLELVGIEELLAAGDASDHMARLAELVFIKDRLVTWLNANGPPTLGQLIIKDELREHVLFTHFSNCFGRGLPAVYRALEKGTSRVPPAELYAKLDDLKPGCRVVFRFHHEHLTSTSAWSELSGQHQLFALGLLTKISDKVIEAIPWVIASPFPHMNRTATSIGHRWGNRLQVFVEEIDSFAKVNNNPYRPSTVELDKLRGIPEWKIKQAFAEIIGEPTITKDWGGERSDLFSDRVRLDGKRISTAFMFKGPAQFAPLTPARLGKNGDQIDRLFLEPADLLILQHCHQITSAVRGQMRAYAQQMGKLRLFCLIDGYDTLRILHAYKKCGI